MRYEVAHEVVHEVAHEVAHEVVHEVAHEVLPTHRAWNKFDYLKLIPKCFLRPD